MPTNSKACDVFLSYSRTDGEFVKQLAEKLEDEHGLKVWFDRWALPVGQSWQQGMADGLEKVSSCVVCVGAQTQAGWFRQEVQVALDRKSTDAEFPVIPTILPGGDPDNIRDFLKQLSWVDLRNGLNDHAEVRALVNGIRRLPPGRVKKKEEHERPLFTVPTRRQPLLH